LPLVRNLSWLMLAEIFSRLSRIVTLFVLAALFSNAQYGQAMLALVVHELFRVFTRLGTGAKIIQCSEAELPATLQNAATLQWLVALGIACLQIVLAGFIARFYAMPVLESLLTYMALAHLFYPIVSVRIFEQHRANQFRYYGLASGACIAFENLFIALWVWIEADVMAVAIAKVAAAIVWVILFCRLPTALTSLRWQWHVQKTLLRFSLATLLSELSRMLRFQSDSLIAARLLTPDQFGLYSFAKSAGLGIAQSFSQAYLSSLYPYLCQHFRTTRSRSAPQYTMARTLTCGICALFLAQAMCALFYVDWLFDARWAEAVPLTALLCLVAVPNLLIDHQAMCYRALNAAFKETRLIVVCAVLLATSLWMIQPQTVVHVGFTVLGSSVFSCLSFFALRGLRQTLRSRSTTALRSSAL